MKRRLGAVLIGRLSQVPLDSRPIGALKNCDPSSHVFARAIHMNMEPQDANLNSPTHSFGEYGHGVRTVKSTTLKYDNPQWDARHPKAPNGD